jgi:hypothetical protein
LYNPPQQTSLERRTFASQVANLASLIMTRSAISIMPQQTQSLKKIKSNLAIHSGSKKRQLSTLDPEDDHPISTLSSNFNLTNQYPFARGKDYKGKVQVQRITPKLTTQNDMQPPPKALLNNKLQSSNPPPANLALFHAQINEVQRQKPDTSFPPQGLLYMLQAQSFLRSSQPPPRHLDA